MSEETLLEKIMRFSPAAIALSACLAVMSSAALTKLPDHEIDPKSLALLAKGDDAARAEKSAEAYDWYETALAVDPRNRAAYIALARLITAQGLKGKAIRYYNEALELDPNDVSVLSEQTEVMISKGSLEAAKKNVARLRIICRKDCGDIDRIAMSVEEAGKRPTVQASAIEIKPVAGQETPPKDN